MSSTHKDATTFPIVCIGFSSGAIQPLLEVFRALNPRTGMAFVLIHHLRKEHPTLLPTILSNCTEMSVQLAQPRVPIEPNHIYVIPSGAEITTVDTRFQLQPRTITYGWSNVVTLFLESLARSSHPGIAVILSGMDDDGAAGLSPLKENGGIIIAQAPGTAEKPQMPNAAIRTGTVDYVLPPEEIGRRLEKIAQEFRTDVPVLDFSS